MQDFFKNNVLNIFSEGPRLHALRLASAATSACSSSRCITFFTCLGWVGYL